MITRENVSHADATRAFGPEVLTCPDCGHGIDPHGTDPGGPCGVSACPCLLQPNGIACLLIEARVREARADALTDAADAWTQGAWASTPRHKDRVADRMAASQYAGDWLRERAEEVRR